MISNCGSDERGKYSGGQAGDQTKNEYRVRTWYDRPWTVVLRHPDSKVGEKLAEIARQAANNEHVGYDQSQRLTYYNELKKVNYKPNRIKTNCESDCSASTAANVIATGYQLGLEDLQKISPSIYSGNARAAFKKAGFKEYTESKYLKSDAYLIPGDILLYEGHHVAINLDKGSKVSSSNTDIKTTKTTKTSTKSVPTLPNPTLRMGDKGTQVLYLQKALNYVMKDKISEDGIFGGETASLLKKFQSKYMGSSEVDAIYGSKTKTVLKTKLK